MRIPFNKPYMTGKELHNISQAHAWGHLAGDGQFSAQCHTWLERYAGCHKALLTHSCTAALEMTALLAELEPGDEVIMPSFTFVSTANAFVLRGAVPVFVDIRPDTLNIDESLIEEAISSRTVAIVAVHYAGVACEMNRLMEIAAKHGLMVIEDAAQGLLSSYYGQPLGSIGDLAAVSFHETKNIISGEGGALLINNEIYAGRAEIIREKGTNRCQFLSGQADKYTWVDVGSSFLPSELIAAFLHAQMDEADSITERRRKIWHGYHRELESLEQAGKLVRPTIPDSCTHNAHLYYVLLPDLECRNSFIKQLLKHEIQSVFHYVPLHNSPMGLTCSRTVGDLPVTVSTSDRLVRLPLWLGIEPFLEEIIQRIGDAVVDLPAR